MSELMTSLALLAYGTAAVVGVQIVASGLFGLSGVIARRNGRPVGFSQDPPRQTAVADCCRGLVLLVAGLFLLLQGVVVVVWTLG